MIIISWNVRGVGSKQKRRLIKESVGRRNPDVLYFQETKVPFFKDDLMATLWKAKDAKWVSLNTTGSAGGILVAWKSSEWDLEHSWVGVFSVSVILQDKSAKFQCLISAVYGPTLNARRSEFWDELTASRQSFSGPCCIVGDFSITRFPEEHSWSRKPSLAMTVFSDWIEKQELVNLPLLGAKFTWTNGRLNSILSRLDRFLVSPEWLEAFPSVSQLALPRTTSDHCPILLPEDDNDWGPKPFRFNSSWLLIEGFSKQISEWWSSFQVEGFGGHGLLAKLRLLKNNLKQWKKSILHKRENEMDFILPELQKIDADSELWTMSSEVLGQRIQLIQSISTRDSGK
ncbi:uncharacterized protein LOC131238909 [Magnolia sinica]|uniref:uncharacterized protein LOC131238909 n=1 Tax=Magnolia sinica TaxID=86752 RepID=UPI00265ACBFF|nr:uncharacterized protein LOC131238909 [Magnolia sinica]